MSANRGNALEAADGLIERVALLAQPGGRLHGALRNLEG
jgi:hypothetical protein